MLPGEGVIHMDSHTKESSIRLLKQLRDVYQGQLDTSRLLRMSISKLQR
jgi:hypothetical protein